MKKIFGLKKQDGVIMMAGAGLIAILAGNLLTVMCRLNNTCSGGTNDFNRALKAHKRDVESYSFWACKKNIEEYNSGSPVKASRGHEFVEKVYDQFISTIKEENKSEVERFFATKGGAPHWGKRSLLTINTLMAYGNPSAKKVADRMHYYCPKYTDEYLKFGREKFKFSVALKED